MPLNSKAARDGGVFIHLGCQKLRALVPVFRGGGRSFCVFFFFFFSFLNTWLMRVVCELFLYRYLFFLYGILHVWIVGVPKSYCVAAGVGTTDSIRNPLVTEGTCDRAL